MTEINLKSQLQRVITLCILITADTFTTGTVINEMLNYFLHR